MAMLNQNYQAEKLMKRLQNNLKKIMSNSRNSQKSTHVAFSFWLMHSSVIVLADVLAQAYILGSAEVRCPFCRNILWTFTRPMLATMIRQYETQF